jgi:plasmid maintenance system antidote protein VapI
VDQTANHILKEYLSQRGITVTEFGKAVGYTPTHASRLANGHRPITGQTLDNIAPCYPELAHLLSTQLYPATLAVLGCN